MNVLSIIAPNSGQSSDNSGKSLNDKAVVEYKFKGTKSSKSLNKSQIKDKTLEHIINLTKY